MNAGTDASPRSDAVVHTDRAARYGKQLVNHLSRKHGGEWDEEKTGGLIQMGENGTVRVQALADSLSLEIEAPDHDALERFEKIVGDHLVRFGGDENFTVEWRRPDSTDATAQGADSE